MSEYQYYEFQAIDRPLTTEEMDALHSCSSRARITPTSFVNDYAWGGFRGNADAWMEEYFDAFLHIANWGTRIVKIRLPARLLEPKLARQYCCGEWASVREKNGKVIVSFVSDTDAGGEWVQGEGLLSSLVPVRAELARGDLRALYLGWLVCAQGDGLGEEAMEPPVPPGLRELSAGLEAMVEFLRIDEDLLHVAAQESPLAPARPTVQDALRWVSGLPRAEKDMLIARCLIDEDGTAPVPIDLLRRFLRSRDPVDAAPRRCRSVRELRHAAKERSVERQQLAAKKAVKDKARQERAAIAARSKYLDGIAQKAPQMWAQVESLVAARQARCYEQAVGLLVDLRDLAARNGGAEFRSRLEALRTKNTRRSAFMARLRSAGLA